MNRATISATPVMVPVASAAHQARAAEEVMGCSNPLVALAPSGAQTLTAASKPIAGHHRLHHLRTSTTSAGSSVATVPARAATFAGRQGRAADRAHSLRTHSIAAMAPSGAQTFIAASKPWHELHRYHRHRCHDNCHRQCHRHRHHHRHRHFPDPHRLSCR